MTKIYKKGNYFYVEGGGVSREELVANVLITQAKVGSTTYFIYFNVNKTDSIKVEFADLVDENNLPFASQEAFREFYTALQNTVDVVVDIDQPLTDAQLRATPVNVTVSNQLDLTTITSYLSSIKDSVANIDINTDNVETSILNVIDAINTNGSVNHADLALLLTELQDINANTDGQETILTDILEKIIVSPSTLAEQQTQTAKLIDINNTLNNDLKIETNLELPLYNSNELLLEILLELKEQTKILKKIYQ